MPRTLDVLLGAVMIIGAGVGGAQDRTEPPRWRHIKTSLFFTNRDVQGLLAKPEERQATLDYFAPLGISKVYLESVVSGSLGVDAFKEIVDDLRARGMEVSGAVVPVGDRGPFCYNNPEDMATLEKRVRELARVVDEIIVDDWLFTICNCARCVEARGDASWADYRGKLVADKSKRHLIDVAKQARPQARVIIKYPNWYEGHRRHGYDVALQTPQFDAVSVGIETRLRRTHDQHIPIYSGYVFQRWIGGHAGPKWMSAWLDNYGMQGASNDYVAQVWQAVLARAPEIIFWCAGQLHPSNPSSDVYPHLVELMPDFDRLAGMLQGPARGIPMHLPIGSVGEYNIFGHLGMIGMPLSPVANVSAEGATPICTLHSLRDAGLAEPLLARLKAGKEVFLTWPLLQSLETSELGRVLNVISQGGSVAADSFRIERAPWQFETIAASRSFAFPRIELSTWPYVRAVALVREDADFGVLLDAPYLEGRMHVLNTPENSYDLLRLPAPVLNAVRRPFFKDLGVRLLGPGGVALYLFGDRQYVLYNMGDAAAETALRLAPGASKDGWKERMGGKSLSVREVEEGFGSTKQHEVEIGVTLQPFEIVLIEAPEA
ncbi:MAG: hypothetical protein JXO72_15300 [Vicinamibacteria bacterium]|nr:hypothetical protein [Vicinamibacteria bacterium]